MRDTNVLTVVLQINILDKLIFGKRYLYPACEKSELFCKIMGSKTIPEDQLKNIRELGFDIRFQEMTNELQRHT